MWEITFIESARTVHWSTARCRREFGEAEFNEISQGYAPHIVAVRLEDDEEEDDEEMGCTCGSEELHGLGYHAHEIECMLIWVPMIQEAVALLGACPVRPQLEVIRTENCHPEEDYHRVIASWEEEDRKFTTILLDELSQDQAHEAIRDIQSRTVRIQAPCAST
tara:strand:- start:375 stop:866 length:492 start_codon:yes stop_codon:yes gene_type:complete